MSAPGSKRSGKPSLCEVRTFHLAGRGKLRGEGGPGGTVQPARRSGVRLHGAASAVGWTPLNPGTVIEVPPLPRQELFALTQSMPSYTAL